MKILNKTLALLLSLILLLGVSIPAYADNSGLIEITDLSYQQMDYQCVDVGFNKVLFVSVRTNKGKTFFNLMVYRAENGEKIASKSYNINKFPLETISSCEVKSDGTYALYDKYEAKCALYDASLNYVKKQNTGEPKYDHTKLGNNNKLIDWNFTKYDTFARMTHSSPIANDVNAVAFYDEPDCLYFADDGKQENLLASNGKNVFSSVESNAANTAKAAVYNYENKTFREVTTRSFDGYYFNSPLVGALDDTYAVFVVQSLVPSEDDSITFSTPFIWKYQQSEASSFSVTKVTDASLKKSNNAMIKDIKAKYEINVLVDKIPNSYPTEWDEEKNKEIGGVVKGASRLGTYLILNDLTGYLSLFPKNFTKEMRATERNRQYPFNIYIDKRIKGSAAAFAQRYIGFYVCFATESYIPSHIPHELMHLIDARIDEYYEKKNKDFELAWEVFNPKNFVYYENQDYDDKSFVTYYAMSDPREDRADTFMRMFEAYADSYAPFEYNTVLKKATLLSGMIRSAYPSARKNNLNAWEKWITDYPEKVKYKSEKKNLKIYWSKSRLAEGYQLQLKEGKRWKTVSNGTARSYVLPNAKRGTAYLLRVRSYRTSGGRKIYSAWQNVSAALVPNAPKNLKLKANSQHQITASWKKTAGSGYQIQFARDKNFKNSISKKFIKKNSYTGKNLTKGNTYYVRVRTYTIAGNKKVYSKWTVKSVVAK